MTNTSVNSMTEITSNLKGNRCSACQTVNIPGTDSCSNCHSDLTFRDIEPRPIGNMSLERAMLKETLGKIKAPVAIRVNENTRMTRVIKIMRETNAFTVIVEDDYGSQIGFITESTILELFQTRNPTIFNSTAKDHACERVVRLTPDQPVIQALRFCVDGFAVITNEPVPRLLNLRSLCLDYLVDLYPSLGKPVTK